MYKPRHVISFTLLLAALFSMCSRNPAGFEPKQGSIVDITAAEAQALIETDSLLVIIDVRTPAEYNSGHIANAVNIDFRAGSFISTVDTLDKLKTYLVYCRSGNRSRSAAELMIEQQFSLLYNMLGGIDQWKGQGYPVTI